MTWSLYSRPIDQRGSNGKSMLQNKVSLESLEIKPIKALKTKQRHLPCQVLWDCLSQSGHAVALSASGSFPGGWGCAAAVRSFLWLPSARLCGEQHRWDKSRAAQATHFTPENSIWNLDLKFTANFTSEWFRWKGPPTITQSNRQLLKEYFRGGEIEQATSQHFLCLWRSLCISDFA